VIEALWEGSPSTIPMRGTNESASFRYLVAATTLWLRAGPCHCFCSSVVLRQHRFSIGQLFMPSGLSAWMRCWIPVVIKPRHLDERTKPTQNKTIFRTIGTQVAWKRMKTTRKSTTRTGKIRMPHAAVIELWIVRYFGQT
jgi:hypothetical protein